jgi:predicted esterase
MILRTIIIALAFGVVPAYAEGNPIFQTYVSPSYSSENPAGLIVYVSPIESGEIPVDWKNTLERRNLIWVSVNESGNSMASEQRISEATESLAFIVEKYVLDEQRIYIAGMSGGAQIASIVAALRPDLFNGGLFFCGGNPWSERDVDPWIESPPEDFDAMKENRYVFVSGTEDFKLAATARVYRNYKKAGIEDSKLIVVDGMGHELPDAETLDRALDFLDRGLTVRKPVEKSTRHLLQARN